MDANKEVEHNLDDFNRILIYPSNREEKMSDENKPILVLNFLSES